MLKADFASYYSSVDGISAEYVNLKAPHNMKMRHFHDEYEIYYMVSGHRVFFIDNSSFLAGPGDLVIINSNMLHMTHVSREHSPDYERIIFYITSKKMREIDLNNPKLQFLQLLWQHHGIFHTTPKQQQIFMHMYDTFVEESNNAAVGFEKVVEAAFVSDFIRILRLLPEHYEKHIEKIEQPRFQYVYEITDYMTSNYPSISRIDDIADHFYISKYHLCRIFKNVTGHSIIDYLTSIRIQKSASLLETSDEPVSEIAAKVGYNSLTHFERAFKKLLGLSPTKYRKCIRTDGYIEGINKVYPGTD